MAVAVLSGTAFAGLVGCTALSRSDGTSTQDDDTMTTADGEPSTEAPVSDDTYGNDTYGDDTYGDDSYSDDSYSDDGVGPGDERFRPAPPEWDGSATPGGDSGSTGSSGSTGPSVRSQGS